MTELETKLYRALKEMTSIVEIHSEATSNNFAWAELDAAYAAIAAAEAAQKVAPICFDGGENIAIDARLDGYIVDLRKDIELLDGKCIDNRSELLVLMLARLDANQGRISELEHELASAVEAEREARKAAQLETIAIREELTKRAMLAESEAYQRGVRDEREACAKVCEDLTVPTRIDDPLSSWITGTLDCANAIRARGNKRIQSGSNSSTSQ